MNIANIAQSSGVGINRTLDNAPKVATDLHGSGKVERPEDVSGRAPTSVTEVQETTVANTEAAGTQVVTATSETQGSNIDIHV